jgi:hypothetical protein
LKVNIGYNCKFDQIIPSKTVPKFTLPQVSALSFENNKPPIKLELKIGVDKSFFLSIADRFENNATELCKISKF